MASHANPPAGPLLEDVPSLSTISIAHNKCCVLAVNRPEVLPQALEVALRELVATPRSAYPTGVEVHDENIDQILSGEFLNRPDWAPGAEIADHIVDGRELIFRLFIRKARTELVPKTFGRQHDLRRLCRA